MAQAVTKKVNIARYADLKDRRRSRDQSRVDPEDPPRQGRARYSPEAITDTILRRMPITVKLHLPAVHRDRHQLPAHPDGRYVEPVHRALDSDVDESMVVSASRTRAASISRISSR